MVSTLISLCKECTELDLHLVLQYLHLEQRADFSIPLYKFHNGSSKSDPASFVHGSGIQRVEDYQVVPRRSDEGEKAYQPQDKACQQIWQEETYPSIDQEHRSRLGQRRASSFCTSPQPIYQLSRRRVRSLRYRPPRNCRTICYLQHTRASIAGQR